MDHDHGMEVHGMDGRPFRSVRAYERFVYLDPEEGVEVEVEVSVGNLAGGMCAVSSDSCRVFV